MLKGYSWPKNLSLLVMLLLSILYALPNVFGEDYALQISARDVDMFNPNVSVELEQRLNDAFAQHEIEIKEIEIDKAGLLVRLFTSEAQLKAQKIVKDLLPGNEYMVALNLAPATPKFFASIGATPMKLGLDLRGGVHFLLEVDSDTLLARHMEGYLLEAKNELRSAKLHYLSLKNEKNSLALTFASSELRDDAYGVLATKLVSFEVVKTDVKSDAGINYGVTLTLHDAVITAIKTSVIEQSIHTLRNRINELGVAEAMVQRYGLNRIVVELPGVQDTARAKEILGKTATIEFRLLADEYDGSAKGFENPPVGTKVVRTKDGGKMLLNKKVVLSGDAIVGATVGVDGYDKPAVNLVIAGSEVNHFKKITRDNIGHRLAVVYIETKMDDVLVDGEAAKTKQVTETVLSAPTIQSALGNKFQITGFNKQEAQNLALYLRSGSLPAAISIVEERTVGPSLGQENIELGLLSVKVGLGLVFVFMIAYYRVFGLVANITLLMNLLLLVAALSIIGATLTLPGIAGMILTVGMAVDANVLIFERIREELRNKVTPWVSINRGFDRAFATIIDSNLTTLIVGIILFGIGIGPVKGFAVTLCLGILTSMITAIIGSRAIINLMYAGKAKLNKLSIGI